MCVLKLKLYVERILLSLRGGRGKNQGEFTALALYYYELYNNRRYIMQNFAHLIMEWPKSNFLNSVIQLLLYIIEIL